MAVLSRRELKLSVSLYIRVNSGLGSATIQRTHLFKVKQTSSLKLRTPRNIKPSPPLSGTKSLGEVLRIPICGCPSSVVGEP